MKIEIMVDPSKVTAPLSSRVTPAATKAANAGTAPMEGVQRSVITIARYGSLYSSIFRTGGRQRRGRGGGRPRNNNRPAKSAEDLDAEMEVGTCFANFCPMSPNSYQ
jgi:hypothetical protein